MLDPRKRAGTRRQESRKGLTYLQGRFTRANLSTTLHEKLPATICYVRSVKCGFDWFRLPPHAVWPDDHSYTRSGRHGSKVSLCCDVAANRAQKGGQLSYLRRCRPVSHDVLARALPTMTEYSKGSHVWMFCLITTDVLRYVQR